MRKLFIIVILCLGWGNLFAQQTVRVEGLVTDAATGETLPGVNVVVKGTFTGVVSDLNGKYAINAPENGTLQFSFVGMEGLEIDINGQQTINVEMSPGSREISEVVVTAMGITREKKALGYAVQTVRSDELTQAASSSLSGALQGKISGVQITPSSGMPGASSQIIIRGARSFSGNNTPLYVIDGMPVSSTADLESGQGDGVTGTDYANRAVDIDPNDIESINILKGQAAAALYGLRASNGVVVITTKSGKGLAKGKAQVSFSSNVSMDRISRYPELQTTYAQGTASMYRYNQSKSWGPKISDLPNSTTIVTDTQGNAVTVGGNGQGHDGKYFVLQRDLAGLDPWVQPDSYNNIKEFFDTGITWNNSLNIAQAMENGSYSVSLGSTSQNGIVPATGMDRYSFKGMADTKLGRNFTTGFTATYVNTSISKMPSANDGLTATVYGAPPSYDLAGIPSNAAGNPYQQNTYRNTSGSFAAAYWALDHNWYTEKTNRFFGNTYVDYTAKLGDNHQLKAKYMVGADAYTTHYQDIWGYGNKGTANNGQIENYGWSNTTINSLLTVNYDWKINEAWSFNALLGNEIIHTGRKYYLGYGSSFDFAGWDHVNNATTKDHREEQWANRSVGFFGNVSASYNNMLYLTLTGRNDIISTMPRGNRSFFYPSASLSFILTELDALRGGVMNYAKLRASAAEVGQAGEYRDNYYWVPTYGSGFYLNIPFMYPVNGTNGYAAYYEGYDPYLKPQNTRSYELGFDVNFWNSLLGLSYTFSRQNVIDQIFTIPLSGSTGTQSYISNGGKIHTNAHEVTLSVNPVRTRNVEWSFAFNWTKIDNYVDELAAGVESIFLGGFVTPQVRAGIGDKFPVIYGTGYLRNDQGQLIVDDDGIPMAGESRVIGNVSPDFILGFNTHLRMYRFTAGAVLDWKSGGQMYSGTNGLLDFYGLSKNTEGREGSFIVDGYKQDGTKNDIAISGPDAWEAYYGTINNIDESSIYNSSFVKLREISVGYQILSKSTVSLSVNAFARNILVWSNYPNFDPESSQGNNNMTGAFERFSLPQTSSFGLGINLKF